MCKINQIVPGVFLILIMACQTMAQPEGYYDPAEGLHGDELRAALHDIIDGHTVISYSDIWTAFFTTDVKPNGMIWDMYSDIPGGQPPYEYTPGDDQGGSAGGEGEGYNREHSWPRSWFGGEVLPMNTDINMIFPSDIYVNNRRSNFPYGEVSNPTWTSMNGSKIGSCTYPGYFGTVFEPIDEYRGDFARAYFYMAVRYYNEDGNWPGSDMCDGANIEPWAVEMLLEWHENDPVSEKETDRNEAVYDIQNNRNPFIDNEGFALLIYHPEAGVEPLAIQPSTFSIEVYPNPFNSMTNISFTLHQNKQVQAVINDVTGREVYTLINTTYSAGIYRLPFDASHLAAGVYFLRVNVGELQSTRRLMLLN